jgi:hypothetical protein
MAGGTPSSTGVMERQVLKLHQLLTSELLIKGVIPKTRRFLQPGEGSGVQLSLPVAMPILDSSPKAGLPGMTLCYKS